MDRNSSHLSQTKHARSTSCSNQSARPVSGKHKTVFSFASPSHLIDFAGYSRRPVTLSPSAQQTDSRGQQFAHNPSASFSQYSKDMLEICSHQEALKRIFLMILFNFHKHVLRLHQLILCDVRRSHGHYVF